MNHPEQDYTTAIRFFLNACPGPPMLRAALRTVALQDVEGIPGLSPSDGSGRRQVHPSNARTIASVDDGAYVRTVAGVAEILGCRPGYLSEAARKYGFSLSLALRWIRFSHGMALRDAGLGVPETARCLGFNDRAGWHRFTVRLVGKSPAQLPAVPLSFWVREAVKAVFLAAPGPRGVPTVDRNMRDDNAGPRWT